MTQVYVQWETPREELFFLFGQSEIAWTDRAGDILRVGKHSYLERGLRIVFQYLDDEMGLAIMLFSSCALFMYVLW